MFKNYFHQNPTQKSSSILRDPQQEGRVSLGTRETGVQTTTTNICELVQFVCTFLWYMKSTCFCKLLFSICQNYCEGSLSTDLITLKHRWNWNCILVWLSFWKTNIINLLPPQHHIAFKARWHQLNRRSPTNLP